MEPLTIKARPRTVTGKQVKALRREGMLPGVVYGAGLTPTPIEMAAREAGRILSRSSGATLIDLEIDGQAHKVLVRETQRDVLLGDFIHVDFLKVAMDELIRTVIPLELTGVAPAVKDQGGVLVTGVSEIEVEALPADLTDRIVVPLTSLIQIDDAIHVSDLTLSGQVRVLTDPDELVARIIFQAEELPVEEEPALLGEEALAEPQVIERGRHEEDEDDGDE
jgi:large subunit ribosomal protein L25